jgi:hypothetical protein
MRVGESMKPAVTACSIVCVLAAMLLGSWPMAVPSLLVWLGVLYAWYRPVLRRIYKPRLWLISGFIAMASGIFLGHPETRLLWVPLSWTGLYAGLWMVMRCIALLTVTAYLSTLLGQDLVIAWLSRKGLSNLAEHIRIAVDTLPAVQDRLVDTWRAHRRTRARFRDLPRVADDCYFALVLQAASLAGTGPACDRNTAPAGQLPSPRLSSAQSADLQGRSSFEMKPDATGEIH